jgi:hypothetical protein
MKAFCLKCNVEMTRVITRLPDKDISVVRCETCINSVRIEC